MFYGFIFTLLWSSSSSHASDSKLNEFIEKHCFNAYNNISPFRQTMLLAATRKFIAVNGQSYEVLGVLGKSSATVYLARTAAGRVVVVKEFEFSKATFGPSAGSDPSKTENVYLEIAKTAFYRERGYSVPAVLDAEFDSDRSLLVKEYVDGVTYIELRGGEGPVHVVAARNKLLKQADLEIDRIQDLVMNFRIGFGSWLQANSRRLEIARPLLKRLREVQGGDPWLLGSPMTASVSAVMEARPGNMIYSSYGKWILFDP